MMTNGERRAWDAGRRALTTRDFADLDEVSNYWILTIRAVEAVPLGAGDARAYVLVFRESDASGRAYDMRLNVSDIQTLRRIYGPSKEWVGQWCVVERRRQGRVGDAFGGGRDYVRVALPVKWRRLVPEVVPEWGKSEVL
jgi:hypothetical protein